MKNRPDPISPAKTLMLAVLGAVLCTGATAQARTFKAVHYFTGGQDGGGPSSGVILDPSGNLYGTTVGGGDAGCFNGTCGVVFELTPGLGGWSESVLYTFTGSSDGGNPESGLIFDGAGNLYGTTYSGGTAGCGFGNGVAFELTPSSGGWVESVLYDFGGTGGCNPLAGLIFDKKGNLYSTVPNGGSSGNGSVYKLAKSAGGWKEYTLYSFNGNDTGIEPVAAPLLDAAGNLYGTTLCCGTGGSVWELLHGSWKEKTLYSFVSGGGANSWAGLVFDKHGNLYGTTRSGGKYENGVVFKLTPGAKGKWKETVLHNFRGGSDGSQPFSTPVFDKVGNLYGTTYWGGNPSCNPPHGCGTVFKLTPGTKSTWKETILHRFNGSDGLGPEPEKLAFDAAGNIYGTATLGGHPGCDYNFGCGVVFEITP